MRLNSEEKQKYKFMLRANRKWKRKRRSLPTRQLKLLSKGARYTVPGSTDIQGNRRNLVIEMQNYKVSESVGLHSSRIGPITCIFDADVSQNLF